jgi:translation initiation factor 2 alpha subunit (eIF-2alpha)
MAIVPEFRTLDKYKKHLKGNSSVLDTIIRAITRHTKCQNNEAAEALLMALYHKWDEPFIAVAVRQGVANGIPPRVMDEDSIKAMLHEASVNWTNACVLFRHLK